MLTEIYAKYKAESSAFSPVLIRHFGAFDGLFLCSLLYWQYSKKLYNDNYFEYFPKQIEQQTGFTKEQQLVALNDLLEYKAIDVKYEGVPVKSFIRLNEELLAKLFEVTKESQAKIDNINQFKKLGTKTKPTGKSKNKFQQFYSMATEKFSDKDLLDLLYKYLQDKIGALSHSQWELCLKHLEDAGIQYPPAIRKTGMLLMVEKAIAGGWFDFYKLTDYQLQQNQLSGFNQFGEPINNNKSAGDKDEWGKNCNFDLAVDENGNPLKF
jgi:hypothetical protein